MRLWLRAGLGNQALRARKMRPVIHLALNRDDACARRGGKRRDHSFRAGDGIRCWREDLVDHGDLRRMNRQPSAESIATPGPHSSRLVGRRAATKARKP